MAYNKTTEKKLKSVSPELKRIFKKLAAEMDRKYPGTQLNVAVGLRTFDEQNKLAGKGKTPVKGWKGYHTHGLALDVVPLDARGKTIWNNWDYWKDLAVLVPGTDSNRDITIKA